MSRKLKNIIAVVIIILLVVASCFTIKLAKDSKESGNGQQMQMPQMENKEAKLDISYYILFGIEAFAISAIIAHLVVTKFNKNTISSNPQKIKQIAIMAVIIIILTAGLTYAQIYITSQTQSSQTQMQGPGANGGQNTNITYTATKEITENETINSGEYTSSESNPNALLASGDIEANVANVTVEKTGDSDGGDSSNFYGNNSAVIAKDGANLTLENIDVTTNASGANGVFSYGGSATTNNSSSDGTTVTISDSTINTTGDSYVNGIAIN